MITQSADEAHIKASKVGLLSDFQRKKFRLTADEVAPVVEVAGKEVRKQIRMN